MSSVLLVVHPDRPQARALAADARSWWQDRGHEVVSGGEDFPPATDFAISLGGDGTMLRTVQLALPHKTPVLGINLGRMGYLAEVEPAGMHGAFERLEAGDYGVQERMILDVSVRHSDEHEHGGGDEQTDGSYVALNETIIERTAPGHTIRVAVAINGRRFLTYVADGLLACTPTGSTAYNLSARGPVLSPKLRAIVLTPIAPHLVFDRSLVLDSEDTIEMTLLEGRPATAVVDGLRVVPLDAGDTITCTGSSVPARLVTFGELDFHAVLRSRFGLSDG
ncbi:MAG: NAD(+)/NADH kinase [Acidimicrobiales bacterium]